MVRELPPDRSSRYAGSSILGKTREAKVKTKIALLFLVLIALPVLSMAGTIPYSNIGTIAPAQTFTATNTGDIIAYFYTSDAGYSSEIGLLVNGVSTGIFGLPNHASNHGDMLDLGHANAGDSLIFQLYVSSTNSSWYSDPSLNSDGVNHAYSTTFGGDSKIPAGIYVAFEDLPNGSADWDYNDHQFVFTNVGSSSTPEPASAMLLAGGLGLLGLRRKRNR